MTPTVSYLRCQCDRRLQLFTIVLFQLALCAAGNGFQPKIDLSSQSELFEIAHKIQVLAPSHFPKPTRMLNDTAVPVVEPTFGQHRADQDVVMVRLLQIILGFTKNVLLIEKLTIGIVLLSSSSL